MSQFSWEEKRTKRALEVKGTEKYQQDDGPFFQALPRPPPNTSKEKKSTCIRLENCGVEPHYLISSDSNARQQGGAPL